MQITRENKEAPFKPFALTILVESEDEQRILAKLFGYDNSIPEWIAEREGISPPDRLVLSKFMCQTYNFLLETK